MLPEEKLNDIGAVPEHSAQKSLRRLAQEMRVSSYIF
jgi:hypothetical protein